MLGAERPYSIRPDLNETSDTAGPATGRRLILGSIVAFGSALTFALNLVLARVVYDTGGNIHGLNITRVLFFLLCLAVVLRLARRPLVLPRRSLLLSLLLGVLLCIEMYTLLGAILFIPVALAVLVMYSYPLIIAGVTWATGREPMSAARLAALAAAFVGLGLALAAPVDALDWRGLTLAGASAVTLVALLLVSERAMDGQDNRVVMLYMTIGGSALIALLTVTVVEVAWPAGTWGWLAFVGSTVFYVTATFMLFTAVSMIGPMRTAAIDNTAPVWAVLFALWLLGETLAPQQLLGVGLVVAALIVLQIVQRPRQPMHG